MDKKEYNGMQERLDMVGAEGQKSIEECRCLIVGLGGLGGQVCATLATSGMLHFGVCDFEQVDKLSVATSLLLREEDISKNKTDATSDYIKKKNSLINIHSYNQRLNESNWADIIHDYDVVVDCSNNLPTNFLIHDVCFMLSKPLFAARVIRETGELSCFPFDKNVKESGCLHCIYDSFPDISFQVNAVAIEVMKSVIAVVASQLAHIVLLSILGQATQKATVYSFDGKTAQWREKEIDKNMLCMCSVLDKPHNSIIDGLQSKTQNNAKKNKTKKEPPSLLGHPLGYLFGDNIEITELPKEYDSDKLVIMDVRNEVDQSNNQKYEKINVVGLPQKAIAHFEKFAARADEKKEYILICYKGVRSLEFAKIMRKCGHKAKSYVGGYSRFCN